MQSGDVTLEFAVKARGKNVAVGRLVADCSAKHSPEES
jgi:hypothetical protein